MRVPVRVTMHDESTCVGEGRLVTCGYMHMKGCIWIHAFERLHMGIVGDTMYW